MPAGEATAVVNNPVCVPRILAGSTSNDPIYQKRTSFIANVIAELLHISAFRNYATFKQREQKNMSFRSTEKATYELYTMHSKPTKQRM